MRPISPMGPICPICPIGPSSPGVATMTTSDQPGFIPPHGNYQELLSYQKAEVGANLTIDPIHQDNYLLDRQILLLEQDFFKDGGILERMTRARLRYRHH